MEISQVEAFLAVGTFGGFRRAAQALRVTQPAISARIKALEGSLGVPLFDRGRSGLVLSPAGRALRPHAEQLLQAVALARQAVHDLRPASGGAVRIAAALSICTYLLPDVLKRFQAAHPSVMMTVRSGHSKEVLEMVLRGEADLGLARSLNHPGVETLSLREDPLVLVGRPALWVGPRRTRLDEVADRPLIFFDRGSSDWTLSHGLFRRAGLVPNVVLEVETIETAKKMVERGLGFAFLPHLAVAGDIQRKRLVAIDIVDAEPLSRSLDVVHPRQRPLTPEARALLRTLRAAVGGVSTPNAQAGRTSSPGDSSPRRATAPISGRDPQPSRGAFLLSGDFPSAPGLWDGRGPRTRAGDSRPDQRTPAGRLDGFKPSAPRNRQDGPGRRASRASRLSARGREAVSSPRPESKRRAV